MKYTLCPPGPEPKRYTASCPEMICALKGGDDLTIDQRRALVLPRPGKTSIEVVPAKTAANDGQVRKRA